MEPAGSRKVFIVHGHDGEAKESLARFIAQLKLTPVILHEQPNGGKTVMEKFESHAADIAYAVVLLTPDDRGGTKNAKYDDQKPRARQNVILELGYFLGLLGRAKVCALYKKETDIPSDYNGVVYISMDDGGWKGDLFKELKVQLPDLDANDMYS